MWSPAGRGFGRYEAAQLVLALLPVVFTAMSQSNFVFAAATTEYRCKVPECESSTPTASTPPWWPAAVDPACTKPRLDPGARPGTCFADSFLNQTEPCAHWLYGDHYSIVSEFNLACQEWKRTLVGTVHNIGVLISMPTLGYVSDRWGRKPSLIISATGASAGALKPLLTSLVADSSSGYLVYLALELLEAAIATATYTTAFVFMLELLGDDKRIISSVALGLAISVGAMLLALVSWLLPYWRNLQLAIYCPALVFLSYWFLLDESLRWLTTTGQTQRAEQLSAKIARWNGTAFAKSMPMDAIPSGKVEEEVTEKVSFKLLFSSKVLLKRVSICSWWWFSTAFVYYGLVINSVSLPGDRALSFALAAAAGVPGELGACAALRCLPRRTTLSACLLAAGLCCLATSLVPKDAHAAQIVLYLSGTALITLCFNVVYTYTSELVPTSARASLVGLCSMVARLGSVLAPLTPLLRAWWSELPTAVFGVAALSGAAAALLAPETRARELPDTVAQAHTMH